MATESLFNAPVNIQTPVGNGSITAIGILDSDASISLEANQDISTQDIATSGGDINLTSHSGAIETNQLNSSATNNEGGDINVTANGDINLDTIDSSGISGGVIDITSNADSIEVQNNINSSGISGGNVRLQSVH